MPIAYLVSVIFCYWIFDTVRAESSSNNAETFLETHFQQVNNLIELGTVANQFV